MIKRNKKKEFIKINEKNINKNIKLMNDCVKNYSKDFPLEHLNNTQRPFYKDTNSFYDFKNTSFINEDKLVHKFIKQNSEDNIPLKCNQIILLPNKDQQKILLNFMEASRIMYNETIKLIKRRHFNKEELSYDTGIEEILIGYAFTKLYSKELPFVFTPLMFP